MTDTEKNILENIALLIPRMNEEQKLYFLGFGEGMAAMLKDEKQDQTKRQKERGE